jgi:hypothetical protein
MTADPPSDRRIGIEKDARERVVLVSAPGETPPSTTMDSGDTGRWERSEKKVSMAGKYRELKLS